MRCEFIRNLDEIALRWKLAEPLLAKCVKKAVRGEYGTDDIRAMVAHGDAVVFLLTEEGDEKPCCAVAMEIETYASGLVMGNVMAAGGRNLEDAYRQFFGAACEWLKQCGCKAVECSCSPAMERLLMRYGDWEEAYRVLRKEL